MLMVSEQKMVTDLHWLRSTNEEVKDPFAKGGTDIQVLELGHEFGKYDCVEIQAAVNEQQPDICISVSK